VRVYKAVRSAVLLLLTVIAEKYPYRQAKNAVSPNAIICLIIKAISLP